MAEKLSFNTYDPVFKDVPRFKYKPHNRSSFKITDFSERATYLPKEERVCYAKMEGFFYKPYEIKVTAYASYNFSIEYIKTFVLYLIPGHITINTEEEAIEIWVPNPKKMGYNEVLFPLKIFRELWEHPQRAYSMMKLKREFPEADPYLISALASRLNEGYTSGHSGFYTSIRRFPDNIFPISPSHFIGNKITRAIYPYCCTKFASTVATDLSKYVRLNNCREGFKELLGASMYEKYLENETKKLADKQSSRIKERAASKDLS